MGYPPGSGPDIEGRLIAQWLSERLGQPFVVENRPGAASNIATEVQVGFSVVTETLQYLKAGKLRALAVTTAARSDVLPDIPTISEFVPGYEASAWVGIGAPKNTPTEIIEKLNADINAGLADRKLKARFTDLGATMFIGSPADFGKFITDETEKWAKVVKFAGIKPN